MAVFTVTLNTAVDVVVNEKEYVLNCFDNASFVPAGKGINVSRALRSAGVKSTAIALVGAEDVELFDTVKCDDIDTVFVPVKGCTRRNITVSNTADGQEHHYKNEGFTASEEDLKKIYEILLERVFEGDWVIFSGSVPKGIPCNAYNRLISLCKTKGAYTALDSSGEAMLVGLQASPYVIKPNREELEEICDLSIDSPKVADSCVRKISALYDIPMILATFAARGGILYSFDKDTVYRKAAVEGNGVIVSTVGSGDSCLAGLIVGLLEHASPEECLSKAMRYAYANMNTPVPGVFYTEGLEY